MRSRSNSSVRLDYYYRVLHQTIIDHQDPITGLVPFSDTNDHAWVRDNVYSIISVWALSLAYRKSADVDEDKCKSYELEKTVVKCMRGLLMCMMRQVDKVEKFKHTQSPLDSLHAKYNSKTCETVVSDDGWGHLQIDATSIYLLMLAQMTASGLQIIFTLNEVAFIQNLVFYIESAYRIPDYGIWERGDKTNHGLPELNASSIGMAKAALEAISGLDLFDPNGGVTSVIIVQGDKIAQCTAILNSMLPRESYSKEVDSALLSVIGFPAFAVDKQELINLTRETILSKCLGRYGCCRFLRDGYRTALEDPRRLHYEPWELQQFENVECEWPVFYAFLSINEAFDGNKDQANDYLNKLSQLLIKVEDSPVRVVPEMYAVPLDKVKLEKEDPSSQDRVPVGQIPHKWGQSLYVICHLLCEGFIGPGELDPLNRRMDVIPKPDTVVQLIVLAEDITVQKCLAQSNFECHTIESLQRDENVVLRKASVLENTYTHLGENEKMALTGRCSGVGLLATATLYRYREKILIFTPEFYDPALFYLVMDQDFVFDQLRTDLSFLKYNWTMLGRPTMVLPIYRWMSDFTESLSIEFKRMITKVQAGYLAGVNVQVGRLQDFLSTSCFRSLAWVDHARVSEGPLIRKPETGFRNRLASGGSISSSGNWDHVARKVDGLVKRMVSITIDQYARQLSVPMFTVGNIDGSDGMTSSTWPEASMNQSQLKTLGYLKVSSSQNQLPASFSGLTLSEFSGQEESELVELLKTTDDTSKQADILHYLYINKGPHWDTCISDDMTVCTVSDLLQELYQKSGALKIWWLVRYTAGMLRKRVPSLASALSDLLVRQKQVTFGLPSTYEDVISQPIGPEEIVHRIEKCCQLRTSTSNELPEFRPYSPLCMLHQEILIYLGMFVRTEPDLFHEMLRIRIGLLIGVMTAELARCLNTTADGANTHLMNLSPYELKNLLYHILCGKEFTISTDEETHSGQSDVHLSVSSLNDEVQQTRSIKLRISTQNLEDYESTGVLDKSSSENETDNEFAQWIRRRRIDGALNRAPVGFYSKIWKALSQCLGLCIEGVTLSQNLIKEMTEQELKFALHVESALNHVPEPEYRQLIVEALITITIFSSLNNKEFINMVIPVNQIVTRAYQLFHEEQMSTFSESENGPKSTVLLRGVSECFYDTAPSGRFGTISYMTRALAEIIHDHRKQTNTECMIQ